MGRKPNKLILEFFERGEKLDDNSNRYQHTCRSCGEKFPKGRIDSLTAHLLKKCPAVNPADRQRALKQLSETPNQHGSYNQLAISIRQEQVASAVASGQQVDDVAGQNNLSPLETLAEVSRQRLDNGQYVIAPVNPKKRKRGVTQPEAVQPDILPDEFFFKTDSGVPATTNDVSEWSLQPDWFKTLRASSPVDEDEHTRAILRQGMDQFTAEQRLHGLPMPAAAPTAQMVPDQLALAASAANEMLPHTDPVMEKEHIIPNVRGKSKVPRTRGRHPPSFSVNVNATKTAGADIDPPTLASNGLDSAIDPQLQNEDLSSQQLLSLQTHRASLPLAPVQHRAPEMSPEIPHAAFLNDFTVTGDAPKNKSRGRFSDTRRKEVQEVRKQGACVRCRMLKKPCSGGTPCNTCKNVESARLWKAPCIRARIADEFDLYGTDLHKVIAFQEISQIKELVSFEKSPRDIEATHFAGTQTEPAIFASVRGSADDANLLYQSNLPFQHNGTRPGLDIELLDSDADDVAGKLFKYVSKAQRLFFESERSPIMRPTLLLAHDLVLEKLDPLLGHALELWAMTHLLVDTEVVWQINSISSPDADEGAVATGDDGRRQPSPTSQQLLTNQLRAHTEKHCAQLGKVLMNDMERRLLQRQQSAGQHFETFLSAVLLLNCVERMCWYFSTWSHRLQNADRGQDDQTSKAMWPLPKHPDEFVSKGEKIAGVVTMLLRMRGVPPTIYIAEDGILRPDYKSEKRLNKNEVKVDNKDEQFALVAAWLDSVQIYENLLREARSAEAWDEKDCRCWDMRYISQLLLPPTPPPTPTPQVGDEKLDPGLAALRADTLRMEQEDLP